MALSSGLQVSLKVDLKTTAQYTTFLKSGSEHLVVEIPETTL